jgi:hypothetical protein
MIEYKIYYFNRLCLSVRSIAHNVKYKRWFLKENIVLYIVMTRQLLTTKINLK